MLEKSLEYEIEAKNGVEQSLRGYKDEVETLKEALSIAAYSVAEATAEEYGYMTEEELAAVASSEGYDYEDYPPEVAYDENAVEQETDDYTTMTDAALEERRKRTK